MALDADAADAEALVGKPWTVGQLLERRAVGLRVGQLSNATLTARKIAECQMLVIGTPSYFNAAGVPRIPADLVRHQVITYEEPLGGAAWIFRQGAAEASVSIGGRVRLSTTVGVRECVRLMY